VIGDNRLGDGEIGVDRRVLRRSRDGENNSDRRRERGSPSKAIKSVPHFAVPQGSPSRRRLSHDLASKEKAVILCVLPRATSASVDPGRTRSTTLENANASVAKKSARLKVFACLSFRRGPR